MKKRNCILGHPGIFFCGGVETHVFLTRERAACFPVRACVSDPPSSYCMRVIVKLWLRCLDAVNCNGWDYARSLPEEGAQRVLGAERGVGNLRQCGMNIHWVWSVPII